ncbi:MAG: hypothetical protein QXU54_03170 [Candidatus Micrarchaeia archaeon]
MRTNACPQRDNERLKKEKSRFEKASLLLSERLASLKSDIKEHEKRSAFLGRILEQAKREQWCAAKFIALFKMTGLLGKAPRLPDDEAGWEGLLLSINLNEVRRLVELKELYRRIYSEYVAMQGLAESAPLPQLIEMTKALRKARAEISRAKKSITMP